MKKLSKLLVLLLIAGLCIGCLAGCGDAKSETEYAEKLTEIANNITADFNALSDKLNTMDITSEADLAEMLELIENARENCVAMRDLEAPKRCKEAQAKFTESGDVIIEGLDLMTECFKNPNASDFSSKLYKASDLLGEGSDLMLEGADLLPED